MALIGLCSECIEKIKKDAVMETAAATVPGECRTINPSRIPFMTKRVSAQERERFEVSVRMIEIIERCSHEKPLRRASGFGGPAFRPACRFPQHAISIAPPVPLVIKPVVYCAISRDLLYSSHSREAPVEPSEETGAGEANGRDGRWVGVRPRMHPPPLESGGSAPGALARPERIGRRGPTESPAGRDAAKQVL